MRRCAGAFRRVCLSATDAILCDRCWAEVTALPPRAWRGVAGRPRPPAHGYQPGDIRATPGSVALPIRGEVR